MSARMSSLPRGGLRCGLGRICGVPGNDVTLARERKLHQLGGAGADVYPYVLACPVDQETRHGSPRREWSARYKSVYSSENAALGSLCWLKPTGVARTTR
jgi:hypothetical protein